MFQGASLDYVSASANRFNHAADTAPQASLIVFGSGKLIALWDTDNESERGVYETLHAHAAIVTCVKFVHQECFVSADEAGVAKVWRRIDGEWVSVFSTQAHSKAVATVAVHLQSRIFVTGGSDSTVKIWHMDEKYQWHERQAISLQGRFPLDASVSQLPQSTALVLALATTYGVMQIYTLTSPSSSRDTEFSLAASVPGHEDWIRAVSFSSHAAFPSNQLVLASGSQDNTIRLWNIEHVSRSPGEQTAADDLLDAFEASLGGDPDEGGRQISLKQHIINVKEDDGSTKQFSMTFDALLIGHEAGVTSLSWRPSQSSPSSPPCLLSTSTDSSLILWQPSSVPTPSSAGSSSHTSGTAQLWIADQRFGDVGGQRLGGFVGGTWGQSGQEALAWGWAGGWRRWQCATTAVEGERWKEVGAVGGHAGPVRGIGWSPGGEYLISAGLDQTTRIHAPIGGTSWHELARPQVHGYDLVGVAFLDALHFVSVADEKVARVFEAPRGFARIVRALGAADLAVDEAKLPPSASVPPLGLSNKANKDVNTQSVNAPMPSRRPFEAELAAETLWPEIEKVFGHGYESISLTVSNNRSLMATACKSTSAKHAVVRIYETKTFQPVGPPLEGHTLTVTRVAFSPDDQLVLTVSRDRTWRLFQRNGDQGYLAVAADKSHARIIWDCSWAPDGGLFATASRDKTVKIWQPKSDSRIEWTAAATLKLTEAVTAVAFAHHDRTLAVGIESGEILVYASTSVTEWQLSLTVKAGAAHIDHIHQLAWRPATVHTDARQLASCSEDGTLKILTVR
ncbi:WD40 repeat-like protein [Auriscalpium vulgare]|uniref:WD40 repeat-like protein n=1 Tax=Auriscalpium vulgare TaxID=40419 RepID=A0ACB8RZ89_9AGAM|nr:WD40 repeat-like protein [Auriscalpium vulgare]